MLISRARFKIVLDTALTWRGHFPVSPVTMSFLTQSGQISVKPFAKVPALGDLPEIQPAKGSVSNVSSRHGIDGGVDIDLA